MLVDTVLVTLVYVGIIIALAVIVVWAFEKFGLPLPPRVVQIIWVIAALCVLIVLWRTLGPLLPAPRA